MHELSKIDNIDVYLVIGILVFFSIVEIISGFLKTSNRSADDWIQEVGSFFSLSILIKPIIVIVAVLLGNTLFPSFANRFTGVNFYLLLISYLLIDDVMQYWYHRSAHEYEFLWKLHRPHHQAEEMGFFVSYRNAALYYFLMPNLWWIGVMTFLGAGKAIAIGLILKQLVIIGSHSTVKWDKPLYKIKFLSPLMSVIERIIITPAFHHAHHGRSKKDTISDPNGNFGNMFSLWDQLFGTAMYTRRFPSEYGLQVATDDKWKAAYLYPLVHSKDQKSELSKGFEKSTTSTNKPISITLEKGNNYLWCACGMSKSQPFCDGSHNGTKHKPLLFTAQKTGNTRICNCKKTKVGPFCDDAHIQLDG